MTYLLDWAKPGQTLLVGLTDPLDAAAEPTLVPGRLGLDRTGAPVVVFVPPGGCPEAADACRLGDSWGAVHITGTGEGWALFAFAPDSLGHLRWQIRDVQLQIRRLLAGRGPDAPSSSRQLAALASTLNQLVCRAALLSEPDRAAAA